MRFIFPFTNSSNKETIDNLEMECEKSIRSGDLKAVEKSVEKLGKLKNLDSFMINSISAIYIAAECDQAEIIKFLLKKGLSNDAQIIQAFKLSLEREKEEISELILKKAYKNQNLSKEFLISILEFDNVNLFIEYKLLHPQVFRSALLFKKKFNFPSDCYRYSTWSLAYNSKKIIKYWIKFDDIRINTYKLENDNDSMNNFVLACLNGDEEIIDLFIKRKDLDLIEALRWLRENPRVENIDKNIIDKVKLLKRKKELALMQEVALSLKKPKKNFNLNLVDDFGNNLMHLAINNYNYKLYKDILIKNSVLLNNFNLNSKSPYDLLVERFVNIIKTKHFESFKEIILRIKFCNIKDSNGDTVLHHVIRSGDLKIIEMLLYFVLLYAPELIFVKNNQGQTPIHIATKTWDSKESDYVVLKFLLNSVSYEIKQNYLAYLENKKPVNKKKIKLLQNPDVENNNIDSN